MNATPLLPTLQNALADAPAGPILVALSGGLDSSSLLHALANLPAARQRGLRAVHVDHGLHPDSAAWATHCRSFSDALGIELVLLTATVARASGNGLEAAARHARFAAIAPLLAPGELLALAQHRDDQSETVLLKLLRGAGPEGLGAMRELRPFGRGAIWRPLLALPRRCVHEYAQMHALRWIDDPSNADQRLSRNFVRHRVLPLLREHWRDADTALGHSAGWNRDAAQFIEQHARQALARLQGLDPATLRWAQWLQLPRALRDPVLRLWLRQLGLTEPDHAQAAELQRQLRDAAHDALPCVRWAGAELRRYRELVYAMPPLSAPPHAWQTPWDGAPLHLPADCGELALAMADADASDVFDATAPETRATAPLPWLHVQFRRGGESLKPAGQSHTRELRLLFQEAGIPPWQRGRIPLLYAGRILLAVADLWHSDAGATFMAQHRCRLRWRRDADLPDWTTER